MGSTIESARQTGEAMVMVMVMVMVMASDELADPGAASKIDEKMHEKNVEIVRGTILMQEMLLGTLA